MDQNNTAGMTKFLLLIPIFFVGLIGCSDPDNPSISLYLAIEREDINQIERHIFWGSDLDKTNINGQTPLHVAATQGSYIVVKLLVEHGANTDVVDREGHTPLGRAALNGRTQIIEYLIERGAEHDPDQLLELVVRSGVTDRDIIPMLQRYGADLDHQNSSGQTPLSIAIANSDRVVVKNLIQNGADVNLAVASGDSPLELARREADEDIISMLRRNGAQ